MEVRTFFHQHGRHNVLQKSFLELTGVLAEEAVEGNLSIVLAVRDKIILSDGLESTLTGRDELAQYLDGLSPYIDFFATDPLPAERRLRTATVGKLRTGYGVLMPLDVLRDAALQPIRLLREAPQSHPAIPAPWTRFVGVH